MELIRIFKSSIIGRRRCRNNRLGISFTLWPLELGGGHRGYKQDLSRGLC